jgi:hypothetical protein
MSFYSLESHYCKVCSKELTVQELADWDQLTLDMSREETREFRRVTGVHWLRMIALCEQCVINTLNSEALA